MKNLNQWAIQWGVTFEAVADLRRMLGINGENLIEKSGESEAAIQTKIRLEASKKGCRLWRNNNGATYDDKGRFIRYGLANDSERMNKKLKSSDLIGIRSVCISESMVGMVFGQFVAREVKAAGWTYTGTDRERAQLAFINLVTAMGGDASFANSEGTL